MVDHSKLKLIKKDAKAEYIFERIDKAADISVQIGNFKAFVVLLDSPVNSSSESVR